MCHLAELWTRLPTRLIVCLLDVSRRWSGWRMVCSRPKYSGYVIILGRSEQAVSAAIVRASEQAVSAAVRAVTIASAALRVVLGLVGKNVCSE